jgi:4-cresol dehydrogenase (hydroxylating) flavoprotein subunit
MTQLHDAPTRVLPPGLSESEFDQVLDELGAAVGSEHVLTDSEATREFRDPFWYASWDDFEASAVVQPESVEEVQAIVRIANEHKVPIWISGVGKNNGYGGSSPRVRGSVVVNMLRMNRVLEIDEELGYAVIEPGVRWFDLYDAIQAGGHKLRLSIADLGWGSVVGNTLDHGITYLPYGQDQMMQCGLEVVLPDGTLMRTGNWAIPNAKAAHVYKRGLGPTPDQLFMQSNYGIVTKMGVWLMPTPECYMPCWLRVWKDSDLPQVIDTLRELMLSKDIEGVPQVLNTLALASVLTPEGRSKWYAGDDPIPDDVLDHIAREMNVGRWIMRFAIYGHEEIVEAKFKRIQAAFGKIDGAEVWGSKYAPDEYDKIEHPAEMVEIGIPNLLINTMTGWYGGEEGGHVAFSPAAPMTGDSATEVCGLLRDRIEKKANLDYIAALLPINARCFIHITMVIFDTKNEQQVRGAYDTCKLLVREAGEQGYGEYRAHLDFMDLATDQYSFNDHAYKRFTETIKDAVDPNGILMPGRHGIWPKAMREAGLSTREADRNGR